MIPVSRVFRRGATIAGALLVLAFTAGGALSAERGPAARQDRSDIAPLERGGTFDGPLTSPEARRRPRAIPHGSFSAEGDIAPPGPRQHGPAQGHLPSARENVDVGRIRRDPSHERCLNLWIVGDNLR